VKQFWADTWVGGGELVFDGEEVEGGRGDYDFYWSGGEGGL